MKNPLISIIVPIYKVEDYLDECIESIINQTYRNLEIILVDDGSPDSCPQKCEEWAARDSRIKVVHKKNGGLSSARNAGLEVATGDYFGFVDSDDFISEKMFEILRKALEKHPTSAISSGMVLAYDGDSEKPYQKNWVIDKERLIKSDVFFKKTMDLSICFTVWNKLYSSNYFKNIRFPEGRNNEDSYYMFELSKIIEKNNLDMIEVPVYIYHYRTARDGSICNSSKNPILLDTLSNYSFFIDYFQKKGDDRLAFLTDLYNKFLLYFLISLIKNKTWRKKYYKEYVPKIRKVSFNDIKRIFNNNKGMYKHYFGIKYIPNIYMRLGKFFN